MNKSLDAVIVYLHLADAFKRLINEDNRSNQNQQKSNNM